MILHEYYEAIFDQDELFKNAKSAVENKIKKALGKMPYHDYFITESFISYVSEFLFNINSHASHAELGNPPEAYRISLSKKEWQKHGFDFHKNPIVSYAFCKKSLYRGWERSVEQITQRNGLTKGLSLQRPSHKFDVPPRFWVEYKTKESVLAHCRTLFRNTDRLQYLQRLISDL